MAMTNKLGSVMALPRRIHHHRPPRHLLPCFTAVVFVSIAVLFLYKVDDVVSRTKTIAGHNLGPTPWHIFPPKSFPDKNHHFRVYKILRCSYLVCGYGFGLGLPAARRRRPLPEPTPPRRRRRRPQCPEFFRWIHRDLEPWAQHGIPAASVESAAREFAAFRATIVGGRLFVEPYYDCVQSRALFTIWGILQLLRRFPGMVPDVDMVFDCMDKPRLNRTTEGGSVPLPLFRYCTTPDHFDIPFPDWSFWGWPETNLNPWDEEFRDIKRGSQKVNWTNKSPKAFWKGNPDVGAPIRTKLLECNDSKIWGAQIFRQDWTEEANSGYEKSKLSDQCNTRYRIYAEGYAWSVSLKYILSCGSLALIISPEYEDFFSRGLVPMKNYWPISRDNLCPSIKYAVEWGIAHPSEAEKIGKAGQDLMEKLSMNRVYDYMFHLIKEYSKLQKFKPIQPPSSYEICSESLLCLANPTQEKLLQKSISYTSETPPCSLQPAGSKTINNEIQHKLKIIKDIKEMELNVQTKN